MNYSEMKQAIQRACEELKVDKYDIFYMENAGTSADALFHDINNFSAESRAGICFRAVVNGKLGQASTEAMSPEEAYRIVESAVQNAGLMENEEEAMIRPAGDAYEETETLHTKAPEAAEMIEAALRIQEGLYKADPRICDGTESGLSFDTLKIAVTNSEGVDLSFETDYTTVFMEAMAESGEEKYMDWSVKAVDFADMDAEELIRETVDNTVSRIGEDSCDTGNYTLVFSQAMTATMLATFFTAFNGEAANQKMSRFGESIGTVVASPLVTVIDDPFLSGSRIHLPFDAEGCATKKKSVIEAGTLKTLLYDMKSAKKAGVESTGNGLKASYAAPVSVMPTNFYMLPGDAGTEEEVYKKVGNGILITALNGLHAGANPVTGDFSLSSAGYLIEDGRKGRPVKNFTISGNFYQWLKDISMVGSEVKVRSPRGLTTFSAPCVVVPDMPVAGK